jgi:ribosomal protein S18 acetylase RimI-like enzyme
MSWDDVPEILRLAGRTPAPPWIRPDFISVFRSSETVGYVALDRERVAGFVLCSVVRLPVTFPRCGAGFLDGLLAWFRGRWRHRRHLELFGLGVVPDCLRPEVERALLEAVVWDLGDWAETIRAVVPETSVTALAFLRGRGFQAVRVFRGYYGREDGYLMWRESVRLPPESRPGPGVGSGSRSAGRR